MDARHDGHSSRATIRGALAWGVALACWVLLAPVASADLGEYRCDDAAKVYFGNPRLFQRPCEISADAVYRQISEYREILDQGLTDRDPRYHFLMKKASERFSKAVKAAARALDHDLVGERGTVVPAKDGAARPPDRTQEVVDRLS